MNSPTWTLHVDGALGTESQEAGFVLKGLAGMKVLKEITFSFSITNDVAEYEALISGLELAKKTDV